MRRTECGVARDTELACGRPRDSVRPCPRAPTRPRRCCFARRPPPRRARARELHADGDWDSCTQRASPRHRRLLPAALAPGDAPAMRPWRTLHLQWGLTRKCMFVESARFAGQCDAHVVCVRACLLIQPIHSAPALRAARISARRPAAAHLSMQLLGATHVHDLCRRRRCVYTNTDAHSMPDTAASSLSACCRL